MLYNDFLNAIIDDGIAEIETEYLRPDQRTKREGGIAGFNACRGLSEQEIVELSKRAHEDTISKMGRGAPADEYWYQRLYQLQIEWVLNVLGAYQMILGGRPDREVTGRGYKKALGILDLAGTA